MSRETSSGDKEGTGIARKLTKEGWKVPIDLLEFPKCVRLICSVCNNQTGLCAPGLYKRANVEYARGLSNTR